MSDRFELIFRHSPIAMALTRRDDGTILDVNEACCRLLRRPRAQLVGQQSIGVGVWQSPEERAAIVARVMRGERVTHHELRLAGGQHVRLSIEPFTTEQDLACLLVIIEDISEWRVAEAGRLDQERRFRAIFDSTFQFIGLLTPDGTLLEANRTALEFAGITTDDVVGRPFWEARWWTVDDATQQQLRDAIARAARGEFVRYPAVVRGRGETLTTIDFSLKPITNDNGEVVLLVPEGRDVGEVRRAQAELHESEERFRSAFEAAAIGMAIVSPDGRFVKVNSALCDLLGYSTEALQSRSFQDITHPDDIEADLEQARRLAAGDIRSYQMEKRYIHRDGHLIWIRLTGSAVRDAAGRLVHFIAQVEDVTARREAQQALERMLDEKDVLLHEVHHRVKNNLQVVSSLLNLQRRTVQDPLTRDALDDSRRRVLAMALVHERLYQGRNLAAVDMAHYLNELVDQLCRTMAVEGVRVRATVNVDQVDVPVDVAIPCGLIVNELLSNVLKYAFAGRETGTVRVSFARADDALELAVIDDGVGMPGDVRTGSIGMRLVESLARQLHGTLSVTSNGGVHAVVRMPDVLIGGRP